MHALSLQSCPTLCNPMDGSPPGSSVHGILQASTPYGNLDNEPASELSNEIRNLITKTSCVFHVLKLHVVGKRFGNCQFV